MAIEIVDFPIENGGSFHSYVTVYQRVHHIIMLYNHRIGLWENLQESPIFDGKNQGFRSTFSLKPIH